MIIKKNEPYKPSNLVLCKIRSKTTISSDKGMNQATIDENSVINGDLPS